MKKLNGIDLFTGCGGLSDGFEQTGNYKMIAHVEWEMAPCVTLIERLRNKWNYHDADKRVLRFDIQRSRELIHGWDDDSEYESGMGLNKIVSNNGGVDIIIGGPPCQAYSVAGRIRDEHGMNYDYRNYLFESYIDIVKFFNPSVVIFENVPGMLSAMPGNVPITKRIQKAFNQSGYEIINNLRENAAIDLTAYGVPQRRKRVILVGIRISHANANPQQILLDFYNRILPKYQSEKKYTVRESIGDLPCFYPAESEYRVNGRRLSHQPADSKIANHYPRFHNIRDIGIFYDLAYDIESGADKYDSIDALKKLYSERTGKNSSLHKYYVLRWNDQSNTIPAHLYKDGLRHIHPDYRQARSITVREAARLQTFDDEFVFKGSLGDQYKMIGNAVPPKFSRALAMALTEFYAKYFL